MLFTFSSQDITADRGVIAKTEMLARMAKADGKPQDFVYIGMDAAAQTKFATPIMFPMTHGGDR